MNQIANYGVVGACDEELREVALCVDGAEGGQWLFSCPVGVEVAASTEDEGIDMLQGVQDDGLVGDGWNDQGYASCCHHTLVVALCEFLGLFVVIARDAYDGLVVGLGIVAVDIVEIRLQVERLCHSRAYSSMVMGISRFRLCSREIRVSVAITPGMPCNLPLSSSMSCSLSRA